MNKKLIRKMLTASGGPLFPWQLNTEWVDDWKFRTTPASRSRVLSGKGVETDKQYTERRKKETTKRTWRSDAADIAHGIGEGVLALNPYTAIPYFGAKVGQDVLNGNVSWLTALNASVPLFHLAPQAVGLREATNVALEDAANAGSKTARNWRIAREINLNIKNNNVKSPSRYITKDYNYNDDGSVSSIMYLLHDPITGKPLGNGVISSPYSGTKGRPVGWIESENGAKGVSEDIYNIAVEDAKTYGDLGIESGWDLMEPLKTLAVTNKFPHIVVGESEGHPVRLLTGTTNKLQPYFIQLSNHHLVNNNIKYNLKTGNFEEVNPNIINGDKTSLKFFERKPSKISEAEKAGVPKGERNNVNNSGNLERTINDIILENGYSLPKETGMFAQKHSSIGSSYRKTFEKLWGKENTDRLTDDLLGKLILIRNHLIDTNIPLKGDFVYVVDGQAKAYRNGLEIGYLNNSYIDNGRALHPEMVKKQGTNNAGVSELLYNGTILAENRPIISGSRLLMPEVTTHIWTKYPTRKLISTEGVHAWPLRTAQERGIKLNYEKNWHTLPEFSKLHQLALDENIRTNLTGLPIYELSEPSYLPIVKNARVFDISLLRNGYINMDFTPGFAYKQGGKMNKIRKMQTAAGGPIKRQKDGYRYIPDKKSKGGWLKITDDAMSDVFSTLEITPNKTRTGSSITRTLLPKSSDYRSAYNPNDIIKGFNALTLGGLNNLSPTLWARRYYDLNQLLASQVPGTKRTMTWSGFVNNWLNGNNGLVSEKFAQEHPYWSMAINGAGDVAALGGVANANKVNLVGNIATKHGGDAAKIAIDVAKNSSKPFNWKNYKFLGDSRFYSDLDDAGYKTIMTERLSGNYPLTFTERRNYITSLKNDILKGIDYAKQEAINNVTTPIKKEIVVSPENRMFDLSKVNSYSDIQMLTPHFGTLKASKKYGQTPWEGNYGAFRNKTEGLFFPFRDLPNTLRTHSMFLDAGERISTGAHEARHTVQSYFDVPLTERRYDMPGTYGRYTNRKLPLDFKKKVNSYINDAGTAGEWEGSLSEMDSELTGWSAKYGFPRYSQMNPQQKALLHDLFLKCFGGTSDYKNYGEISSLLKLNPDYNTSLLYSKILDDSKIGQIILGLETLGYRKHGGKMNILEFLKNGSGIHIKEKNKGKFTSYCGGKVTNECILKGKNSSNPAIRKRATFADNARHFKHKSGGKIDFYNLGGWFKNTFNNVSSFLGSDTGKSVLSIGSGLLGLGKGISNSGKIADAANEAEEAINALESADRLKSFAEKYASILLEKLSKPDIDVNGSPIHTNGVNVSNEAYNLAINTFKFDNSEYNQMRKYIKELALQVLNENSSSMIGSVGGLIDSIGGIAGSLLNKKSTTPKSSLIITGSPDSSKQVITTNSGMSGTVDDWRKAILG